MTSKGTWIALMLLIASAMVAAQQSSTTVPVHMVVTAESTKNPSAPQNMTKDEVFVKQGKDRLKVTDWIPARGEQAALQLFVLIDDTSDSRLGSQLDEIRSFINAQPATTVVAVGYMRNANVTIVQDFTADHEAASKALRLPLASLSSQDNPYLSLMSLLKRWPENKTRREVVMVSDGIDRSRGYAPSAAGPAGFGPGAPPNRPMPYISPDVDSAIAVSQRTNVIVHTIFAPGVGRADRNYFELNNGLNGLAKLSDETGGESFSLSVQPAVSFQPYFQRLQTIFDNQYFLVFEAKPGKKAGLQRVRLDTEVPFIEFVAPNMVWVPGTTEPKPEKK